MACSIFSELNPFLFSKAFRVFKFGFSCSQKSQAIVTYVSLSSATCLSCFFSNFDITSVSSAMHVSRC